MSAQQPKLVNKQFNSPIGLYSDKNIREILDRESQMLANGAVGINFHDPMTNKPSNLHNSAVLRMLEEEESKQRGVKRVAWPPPKDAEDEYTEQEPIESQGGAQYSSQTPGLQKSQTPNNFQQAPIANNYQQPRPATPQTFNTSAPQSPLIIAKPVSPAFNQVGVSSKNWAPVQSPTSPQPIFPSGPQPYQSPNQYQQTRQQYQPVQQSYQAPQQTYQAPQQAYQAPQQIYQAPQQTYQAPQQTCQAPQQQPQQIYQSSLQIGKPSQQGPQQHVTIIPIQIEQPSQQVVKPPQQVAKPPQPAYQPPQQVAKPPQQVQQPPQQVVNPPQPAYQPPHPNPQSPQPAQPVQQPPQPSQQVKIIPIQIQQQPPQNQVAATQQQQVQQQPQYKPAPAPVKQVEPPPTTITLRPKVPISQAPAPVFTSQPATATLRGGKNLRGDLKWPPENVRERMEAETKHKMELEQGPACKPRKINKDYSRFFAQHALNSTYPGYKVPPGTQYYEHHPVM